MNVVAVSRIVGTFLGYAPRVVHRLDDGNEWEQRGHPPWLRCGGIWAGGGREQGRAEDIR